MDARQDDLLADLKADCLAYPTGTMWVGPMAVLWAVLLADWLAALRADLWD